MRKPLDFFLTVKAPSCLLGLSLLLAGCSKPAPPPIVGSTPAEQVASRRPTPPPVEAASPVAEPMPLPVAPAPGQPAGDTPLELETRYLAASTSPQERKAIVDKLGHLGSAPSAAALGRIFDRERRLETRQEVLQVVADLSAEDCQAAKFAIFSRAAAPAQPVTMRLGAMQTLVDLGDPRTPEILRAMTRDENSQIRETARRLLGEEPVP